MPELGRNTPRGMPELGRNTQICPNYPKYSLQTPLYRWMEEGASGCRGVVRVSGGSSGGRQGGRQEVQGGQKPKHGQNTPYNPHGN